MRPDSALVYDEGRKACLASPGVKCADFEVQGSCLPASTDGQPDECEYYKLECGPGTKCSGGVCKASVEATDYRLRKRSEKQKKE